jgi:hypothetical protein
MAIEEQLRADFESAMGEEFGDLVSPPVPFLEASPHECCEAIWLALGRGVTPDDLASLSVEQLGGLAQGFANWFDCEPPPTMQIAEAVARTLARWPSGSLSVSA